jgi:diguanylate cyclase (GGDEF)-like protein
MRARPGSTTKLASKRPATKRAGAATTTGKALKARTKAGLTTAGKVKARMTTAGTAKTGTKKAGTKKSGMARIGLATGATTGIAGTARQGMVKLGLAGQKSRRPGTRTMIVAGAACAVAGIAALPVTRRAFRRLVATWQNRRRTQQITQQGLDELTGLPNRAQGERMLGAALTRAQARGRRVALLYVDLDDFKLCNDTYGSDAGDHVLQVTAARMQAQLRSGDIVCRFGGDDFIVIMESAGPDHTVSRIAERISDAIAHPISFAGETILVGGSVGIAVAVNGDAEIDELVDHGYAAVDRARAAGRHVVQY